MNDMTLPVQLVQQLINYLQKRPWDEANPFIMEIVKYAPKPEEKPQQKVEENVNSNN